MHQLTASATIVDYSQYKIVHTDQFESYNECNKFPILGNLLVQKLGMISIKKRPGVAAPDLKTS